MCGVGVCARTCAQGSPRACFRVALVVTFYGDTQIQNPIRLEIQKDFFPQANLEALLQTLLEAVVSCA